MKKDITLATEVANALSSVLDHYDGKDMVVRKYRGLVNDSVFTALQAQGRTTLGKVNALREAANLCQIQGAENQVVMPELATNPYTNKTGKQAFACDIQVLHPGPSLPSVKAMKQITQEITTLLGEEAKVVVESVGNFVHLRSSKWESRQ